MNQTNNRDGGHSEIYIIVGIGLLSLLTACSSQKSGPTAASSSQPSQTKSSAAPLKALADFDPASKTPEQLSAYIFENHGCKNCHTMGEGGKLGFTERGKKVGQHFEGCVSLLTSMNVIALVKEADRSSEEKQKAARFQEFGCTTCHQIAPGKMGLSDYGKKLASMHLACTDVERILASKQ